MTNIEIENIMKGLKITNFEGVFSRDTIPKINKKSFSMVINLDSALGQGTHWVGLIKKDGNLYYYDSFGLPPLDEILKLYPKNKLYYSNNEIQNKLSFMCGYYVIHFIESIFKKKIDPKLYSVYFDNNTLQNEDKIKNISVKYHQFI